MTAPARLAGGIQRLMAQQAWSDRRYADALEYDRRADQLLGHDDLSRREVARLDQQIAALQGGAR